MRYQKAGFRGPVLCHTALPQAGGLWPALSCLGSHSQAWGGGWRGWSLQEPKDTAEPLTAPALVVVAEMLWGSTNAERELKNPLPHEHEIIGFAALDKLQYAIYELRTGSRKAVQAGHCCCLCPAARERQLDPLCLCPSSAARGFYQCCSHWEIN